MVKQKILIAGIGGVGGYFGGLLAKAYEDNTSVEIYFYARGAHLKKIQESGLKVIQGTEEFKSKPNLATNDPSKIAAVDWLLICTKTYDLENITRQLLPCISEHTKVLPLLNGVDSKQRLGTLLPKNEVLNGCVYIISKIASPGVIENFGNIQTLYFGLDQKKPASFLQFEKLLKNAGIEASCTDQISKVIWEKFIFISATATATSYFDNTIGELLEDQQKLKQLKQLITEVTNIARAKKIEISPNIQTETLNKLTSLPYETTSSMQRDYRMNRKTEVMSLTAFVVNAGKELNILTSAYSQMLAGLLAE